MQSPKTADRLDAEKSSFLSTMDLIHNSKRRRKKKKVENTVMKRSHSCGDLSDNYKFTHSKRKGHMSPSKPKRLEEPPPEVKASLTKLYENKALHEKLAESINQAIQERCEEDRINLEMEQQLESAISTVIEKTESDPTFESFLNDIIFSYDNMVKGLQTPPRHRKISIDHTSNTNKSVMDPLETPFKILESDKVEKTSEIVLRDEISCISQQENFEEVNKVKTYNEDFGKNDEISDASLPIHSNHVTDSVNKTEKENVVNSATKQSNSNKITTKRGKPLGLTRSKSILSRGKAIRDSKIQNKLKNQDLVDPFTRAKSLPTRLKRKCTMKKEDNTEKCVQNQPVINDNENHVEKPPVDFIDFSQPVNQNSEVSNTLQGSSDVQILPINSSREENDLKNVTVIHPKENVIFMIIPNEKTAESAAVTQTNLMSTNINLNGNGISTPQLCNTFSTPVVMHQNSGLSSFQNGQTDNVMDANQSVFKMPVTASEFAKSTSQVKKKKKKKGKSLHSSIIVTDRGKEKIILAPCEPPTPTVMPGSTSSQIAFNPANQPPPCVMLCGFTPVIEKIVLQQTNRFRPIRPKISKDLGVNPVIVVQPLLPRDVNETETKEDTKTAKGKKSASCKKEEKTSPSNKSVCLTPAMYRDMPYINFFATPVSKKTPEKDEPGPSYFEKTPNDKTVKEPLRRSQRKLPNKSSVKKINNKNETKSPKKVSKQSVVKDKVSPESLRKEWFADQCERLTECSESPNMEDVSDGICNEEKEVMKDKIISSEQTDNEESAVNFPVNEQSSTSPLPGSSTEGEVNKNSVTQHKRTPVVTVGLRQSLSTPRRPSSHVRALEFKTPESKSGKQSNTSPKSSTNISGSEALRNIRKGSLFKSPSNSTTEGEASTSNAENNPTEKEDKKISGVDVKPSLKKNTWDASLRLYAISTENQFEKRLEAITRSRTVSSEQPVKVSNAEKNSSKESNTQQMAVAVKKKIAHTKLKKSSNSPSKIKSNSKRVVQKSKKLHKQTKKEKSDIKHTPKAKIKLTPKKKVKSTPRIKPKQVEVEDDADYCFPRKRDSKVKETVEADSEGIRSRLRSASRLQSESSKKTSSETETTFFKEKKKVRKKAVEPKNLEESPVEKSITSEDTTKSEENIKITESVRHDEIPVSIVKPSQALKLTLHMPVNTCNQLQNNPPTSEAVSNDAFLQPRNPEPRSAHKYFKTPCKLEDFNIPLTPRDICGSDLEGIDLDTPLRELLSIKTQDETPLTKLLRENGQIIGVINTPSLPPTPSLAVSPFFSVRSTDYSSGSSYYKPELTTPLKVTSSLANMNSDTDKSSLVNCTPQKINQEDEHIAPLSNDTIQNLKDDELNVEDFATPGGNIYVRTPTKVVDDCQTPNRLRDTHVNEILSIPSSTNEVKISQKATNLNQESNISKPDFRNSKITDFFKVLPAKPLNVEKPDKKSNQDMIDDLLMKAKTIVESVPPAVREHKKMNRGGKLLSMVKIQMLAQCDKKLSQNIPLHEESKSATQDDTKTSVTQGDTKISESSTQMVVSDDAKLSDVVIEDATDNVNLFNQIREQITEKSVEPENSSLNAVLKNISMDTGLSFKSLHKKKKNIYSELLSKRKRTLEKLKKGERCLSINAHSKQVTKKSQRDDSKQNIKRKCETITDFKNKRRKISTNSESSVNENNLDIPLAQKKEKNASQPVNSENSIVQNPKAYSNCSIKACDNPKNISYINTTLEKHQTSMKGSSFMRNFDSSFVEEIKKELPVDDAVPGVQNKKLIFCKQFLRRPEIVQYLANYSENSPQKLILKPCLKQFFKIFYKWLKHPHKDEMKQYGDVITEYLTKFEKVGCGLCKKKRLSQSKDSSALTTKSYLEQSHPVIASSVPELKDNFSTPKDTKSNLEILYHNYVNSKGRCDIEDTDSEFDSTWVCRSLKHNQSTKTSASIKNSSVMQYDTGQIKPDKKSLSEKEVLRVGQMTQTKMKSNEPLIVNKRASNSTELLVKDTFKEKSHETHKAKSNVDIKNKDYAVQNSRSFVIPYKSQKQKSDLNVPELNNRKISPAVRKYVPLITLERGEKYKNFVDVHDRKYKQKSSEMTEVSVEKHESSETKHKTGTPVIKEVDFSVHKDTPKEVNDSKKEMDRGRESKEAKKSIKRNACKNDESRHNKSISCTKSKCLLQRIAKVESFINSMKSEEHSVDESSHLIKIHLELLDVDMAESKELRVKVLKLRKQLKDIENEQEEREKKLKAFQEKQELLQNLLSQVEMLQQNLAQEAEVLANPRTSAQGHDSAMKKKNKVDLPFKKRKELINLSQKKRSGSKSPRALERGLETHDMLQDLNVDTFLNKIYSREEESDV